MTEENNIKQGFDRGVDFLMIKNKLLQHIEKLYLEFDNCPYEKKKKFIVNKICYTYIALIQLRNGSRISEACDAFCDFYSLDNLDLKVIVKIAKSSGKKYNVKTKQNIEKKARYRKMVFPEWIDRTKFDNFMNYPTVSDLIQSERLEKRVLDYLLLYFQCNTHSLRYSYINFMLNEKKISMPTVAKIVGHTTVGQLVTYTQNKQCDFVMDMHI